MGIVSIFLGKVPYLYQHLAYFLNAGIYNAWINKHLNARINEWLNVQKIKWFLKIKICDSSIKSESFSKATTQMVSFFPAQSKAMPNDPERFLEMGGWRAHVD